MNKIFLTFLFIISLSSCDGSDDYQGKWKALDSAGNKFEISFSPRTFSIKDSLGKTNEHSYLQNAFKHENAVDTYGIKLDDGRGYEILFPKKDESVGIIKDENGKIMFTISRHKYLSYDEIYKLN